MDLFSSLDTHIPPRLPTLGIHQSNLGSTSKINATPGSLRNTIPPSSTSTTSAVKFSTTKATVKTTTNNLSINESLSEINYNRTHEEKLRELLYQPANVITELSTVEKLLTVLEQESKIQVDHEKNSIGFQYRQQHQHYQTSLTKENIQYTLNDKGELISTFPVSNTRPIIMYPNHHHYY